MPAAPTEIGPFRVLGPLGQGGMGTVWLAEDPRLGRRVAVKLFAGPEARTEYARDQLLREARAAAALSHANIAAVHDVLDVDGQVAVVFEYVEGDTLAARIARGPLAITAVVRIALHLAEALGAAHERGIVHRDLKPPNIVVTRDGGVKVLDFGVARVLPAVSAATLGARTTAGGFVGTIGYAAPEQCLGEAGDARADIFSLGVVMYEALTGERPFPGADATTVMRAIMRDEPPRVAARLRQVPDALDRLIARMLSAEPAQRPQTARDIVIALQTMGFVASGSSESPAPRRRVWATAALVGVALLTGALVSSLASIRPASDVTKPPVVAVMPLTNGSGDPANDYIALGIADSLITRLAALPSVTVLSRAAVSEARSRNLQSAATASELGATYLVDGSVQHIDDELSITLTLLRPDGSVAWANTVRGPVATIFELQTRLASTLSDGLSVQLSAADRARIAAQPTMNADALAAYWRGRALFERRDIRGNAEAALASFDEAVRLDTRFADAHAGRAEAYWARYLDVRDPALANAALDAGLTALRLDPDRPAVRYSLALTLKGRGDLTQAEEELRHALMLQPNYDDARRQLGDVLASQGKIDAAITEYQKAIALRENYWSHHSALGLTLLGAARYEDAASAFSRSLELQPDNASTHSNLGSAYHYLNRLDEALASYSRAIAIRPTASAYSNLGAIHHQRGEMAKAVEAYKASLKLRPNAAATHRNLGDAYRRMGRPADARVAYREAMRLAEAGLTVNPSNAEALASAAVFAAKAGEWSIARRRLDAAQQLAPANVQVVFRSAVVHALSGNTDAALDALEHAVRLGFSRSEIAVDEDFAALKSLPRFKSLIDEGRSDARPR